MRNRTGVLVQPVTAHPDHGISRSRPPRDAVRAERLARNVTFQASVSFLVSSVQVGTYESEALDYETRAVCRRAAAGPAMKRGLLLGTFAIAIVMEPLVAARGQGINTRVEGAPRLDAVSVQPSGVTQGPMRIRANPGRVDVVGASLQQLISNAFGEPGSIPPFRLAGLAPWMLEERWDVQATVADARAPLSPTATMVALRAVLLERFKLRMHVETREGDVYLLMPRRAGATGTALKVTTLDCAAAGADAPLPATGPPFTQSCDAIRIKGGTEFLLEAWGVTMARLATQLSGSPVIGKPVLDRTGLVGRFDVTLRFTAPPASPSDVAPSPADISAPSLPLALEEQLGLTLQASRAAIDTLVIDAAERPNPN